MDPLMAFSAGLPRISSPCSKTRMTAFQQIANIQQFLRLGDGPYHLRFLTIFEVLQKHFRSRAAGLLASASLLDAWPLFHTELCAVDAACMTINEQIPSLRTALALQNLRDETLASSVYELGSRVWANEALSKCVALVAETVQIVDRARGREMQPVTARTHVVTATRLLSEMAVMPYQSPSVAERIARMQELQVKSLPLSTQGLLARSYSSSLAGAAKNRHGASVEDTNNCRDTLFEALLAAQREYYTTVDSGQCGMAMVRWIADQIAIEDCVLPFTDWAQDGMNGTIADLICLQEDQIMDGVKGIFERPVDLGVLSGLAMRAVTTWNADRPRHETESAARQRVVSETMVKWLRSELEDAFRQRVDLANVQAAKDPGQAYIQQLVDAYTFMTVAINEHLALHVATFTKMLQHFTATFMRDNALVREKDPQFTACELNRFIGTCPLDGPYMATVLAIVAILDDQDLFCRLYYRSVCKRLLRDARTCDDELTRALRLRQVCGTLAMEPVQVMVHDVQRSADGAAALQAWLANTSTAMPVPTTFSVLTSRVWPLSGRATKLALPVDMAGCIAAFEQYYQFANPKRVLRWMWQCSTAHIAAHCFRTPVTLVCTVAQAVVLLQFAERLECAVSDLAATTDLDEVGNAALVACVTFCFGCRVRWRR